MTFDNTTIVRRVRLLVAASIVAMVSAACSGGSAPPPPSQPAPTPPPATVTSIDVVAQTSNFASATAIAKGSFVQFTAIANLGNSTQNSVTQSVTWSSSDATIIAFERLALPGSATAVKEGGPVTITATDSSGVTGTLSYSVSVAVPTGIAIDPPLVPNGVPVGQQGSFMAIYTMTDGSKEDATGDVDWSSSNGGVVVVGNDAGNKGKAIALAAGDSTISAVQGALRSTDVAIKVFTPEQVPEFVTEPATPDQLPLGRTLAFRALLKYSTGQVVDVTDRVVWVSSDESIAQFPADWPKGLLLANPAIVGSTTITAQDPASTTMTAGIAVDVANIGIGSVVITPEADAGKPLNVGEKRQLGVIATFADNKPRDISQTVDWSTAGTNLSVENKFGSKGLVTAISERPSGQPAGSITITDPISGGSVGVEIDTVGRILERIEIAPVAGQALPKGRSQQFEATSVYSGGTADPVTALVTWHSSATDRVVVSNSVGSEGKATAVGEGTAVITAVVNVEGTKYTSNSVVVDATAAALQSMTIEPAAAVELAVGKTQQLKATGSFSDGTSRDLTTQVNWRSADTAIVTVTVNGKTGGVVRGEAIGGPVTVNASDPASTVNASRQVSVTGKMEDTLSIRPSALTSRPIGRSFAYDADLEFSDGSVVPVSEQVQWTSSNPAVARISNEPGKRGTVTGLTVGDVQVTASGGGLDSAAATFRVTGAILDSISVTPSTPQGLNVSDSRMFTARGNYSDGSSQDITGSVVWDSDNRSVATISSTGNSSGVLIAEGAGLANVTATQSGVTSAPPTEVVVTTGPGGIGGGFGSGVLSVTVEPGGQVNSDGNMLTCAGPNTCELELPKGTIINLFAIPNAGQQFEEWDQCDAPSSTVCTVTIDNDLEAVKAEFDPQ